MAGMRLATPSGGTLDLDAGGRLVFGRGPDVDVIVRVGRGLSRRAGLIAALPGGVWIANISLTHALYAETAGEQIRLPRLETPGEPRGGWFLRDGEARVGSRSMLEDGLALRLEVSAGGEPVPEPPPDGESTLLPLTLDRNTKLFLVALLWCRPWMLDPSRTTALPRTPEIARAALEITGASYELDRFSTDPVFRERLADRVGEHLRALRRKLVDRLLVRRGMRLSDEVVVGVLLDNAAIVPSDLLLLSDPAWLSRQENLWWDREDH
ncbi:hypothetical protein [Actinocorallia longicatena]|uniref:FHA domain-containing protein n=1 Tax=Actinocorallia longicatena TaxID=111803 RepID=A0ABP6Q7R7_9ACTN